MHCPIGRTVHRHPYINRIMEADILFRWKPLNLERYDETINRFKRASGCLPNIGEPLHQRSAILCRVFLTSLKGETLTWHGGLPPRSIDSFDTLIKLFSAKYTTNRSHRMTSAASEKKFIDRFESTVVQIRNLNHEIALHSMLIALCPNKFANSMCKKQKILLDLFNYPASYPKK